MGQRLVEMYSKAVSIGGLKAKMRLAMLTGVPSAKAASEADAPDILSKFQNALREIEKESR